MTPTTGPWPAAEEKHRDMGWAIAPSTLFKVAAKARAIARTSSHSFLLKDVEAVMLALVEEGLVGEKKDG